MEITLNTEAERLASEAESLNAFSGINLLHIKRSIAELLRQIGGNGIFDEYTRHDITHIDAMLKSLEWIIPPDSKTHLRSADWLMIVLAIYFHDLGMLVTRDEFSARDKSGFPQFCERILFAGDEGYDYKVKLGTLTLEQRERFLYQEFVRERHAERIKYWVTGTAKSSLGIAPQVVEEIDRLLTGLNAVFRRDLALVCESHHLDDLDNISKYKVRQPYGQSPQEIANIHYSAILLRTADLLHIMADRTPSVTFRTLNPADPISQIEWAKQMAVRAVLPKPGRDKEGNVSASAVQDTVEVHAYFESSEGFFGLTSYLAYAQAQLKVSSELVEAARQTQGVQLSFPWRYIDDTNVETKGFLSQPFEFTLDQAKILDLLTGHTLYNDSSVVIRELAQNSIDAVRLQCMQDKLDSRAYGSVVIRWDSRARVLEIEDNGTGMSQMVIERHLLKVGSSRYQDPDFKKKYPTFNAISRFGIGVLSCFMIADSVEITTVHPDDEEARQLTLRSVHGRYLISLLDKEKDERALALGQHGTRFRLQIRPSAKLDNPVEIARKWIVIPDVRVSVDTDGKKTVIVGYPSPKEALEATLVSNGYSLASESPIKSGQVRVRQFLDDQTGVTLAVAVQWSEIFQEWTFLIGREGRGESSPDLGICVEGIRVYFDSPGFRGFGTFAIANAKGRTAPRTNVARSGLEETPEGELTLAAIYKLYMQHVLEEVQELQHKRKFSVTWSVQEASILIAPFLGYRAGGAVANPQLLRDAVKSVPLVLLESNGVRRAATLHEVNALESFWTVEGGFFESAETLLREIPTSVSLGSLVKGLNASSLGLPDGELLCRDAFSNVDWLAFRGRVPGEVKIDRSQRRLDVLWRRSEAGIKWTYVAPQWVRDQYDREEGWGGNGSELLEAMVCEQKIPFFAEAGEIGFRINGRLWLIHGTPLSLILLRIRSAFDSIEDSDMVKALTTMVTALENAMFTKHRSNTDIARIVTRAYEEHDNEVAAIIPRSEILDAIGNTDWRVFDPQRWVRKEDGSRLD